MFTPDQAFVHAHPSFTAEEVLPNGRRQHIRLPDTGQWSIVLSLNVGLE